MKKGRLFSVTDTCISWTLQTESVFRKTVCNLPIHEQTYQINCSVNLIRDFSCTSKLTFAYTSV
jgi:hypothetical protein